MPKADPVPRPTPVPPAPPSAGVVLGYRLLKLAAFVVALPAALICLSALIGALTENGYARILGAVGIALVVPLVLADRLLPAHDPTRARGLVSDVCAVTWVLIAFVTAALANGSTRPLLAREGDRLVRAGYVDLGRAAYLLAGVRVEAVAGATEAPALATTSGATGTASAALGAPDAAVVASAAVLPSKPDGGKAAARPEKTPAELFRDLAPSVVTIIVNQEGGGTGFVVDKDGVIATNHHVIDGATHVRIKFQSGAMYEDIELLADEVSADLALLRVNLDAPLEGGPRAEAIAATLGDSDAVVVGERAVSIGNPLGLDHTLTDGLISSRRIYRDKPWIQFSAPVSPGNSGGPLFDMRGDVVGITAASLSGGFSGGQNLNLAIPINELKKLFRPVYAGRRKLGDANAPSHW